MKKYFLTIIFLMIVAVGFCAPPGALMGYDPASDTFRLLTVSTPAEDTPTWPFSYPVGTALGFYPASGTYHPFLVDASGSLIVDAGGSSLWTDNGDSISASEPVIIGDDLTVTGTLVASPSAEVPAIVVPKSEDYTTNTGIKLDETADTGIFTRTDGIISIRQAGNEALALKYNQTARFYATVVGSAFCGSSGGSAAYPSVCPYVGDNNTGMWGPSTDALAFSTGGVEAMRVADNQNLLIGTTFDSGEKLQVEGKIKANGDGAHVLRNNSIGDVLIAEHLGDSAVRLESRADYAGIYAYKTSEGAFKPIVIGYGTSSGSNVLIGTTTDNGYKLEVSGSAKMDERVLIGLPTDDEVTALQVNGSVKATGIPTYADNAAALAGGLVAGAFYKTATGQLMIVY